MPFGVDNTTRSNCVKHMWNACETHVKISHTDLCEICMKHVWKNVWKCCHFSHTELCENCMKIMWKKSVYQKGIECVKIVWKKQMCENVVTFHTWVCENCVKSLFYQNSSACVKFVWNTVLCEKNVWKLCEKCFYLAIKKVWLCEILFCVKLVWKINLTRKRLCENCVKYSCFIYMYEICVEKTTNLNSYVAAALARPSYSWLYLCENHVTHVKMCNLKLPAKNLCIQHICKAVKHAWSNSAINKMWIYFITTVTICL